MAASSSEAYDVFLSFRGEDTRQNLISHLYAALRGKGIRVFLDDEGIERGDELSPTLLEAIERSRISIITFSEDYASSRWCLDELVQIIECKETRGQIVLPVFYNVPPSWVRNQGGRYETAFVKHEKYNQSKVQKWKVALREAANLAGWDSTKTRSDFELVTVVVEDVLQKLNYIMEPLVPSGLVGIDKRIAEVESLLCNDRSNDVCMFGIYGMGGVGKTTLAKTLFQKHFSQFEGHCFLSNVREKWTDHGYVLQNELLTQILGGQIPNINSKLVVNRLRQKKILMVLDDVSDPRQLEYLIGKKEWYGLGSKIIVTTRDKSVLQNDFDGEYGVMPLDYDEGHKLFCLSAFKQYRPKSEFIDQTDMAVDYAGGNPLALKVLGSHLQSKNTREWESALKKLRKVPNPNIYSVLRWSYEELDYEVQQIFLDIACILKGEKKSAIIDILHQCNFSGEIGMRILQDKSLITLEKDQTIWMHDLIQEMGQHIVREESIKRPEGRSRLWEPEEVYHILKGNTGTDAIEGIKLDMSRLSRDLSLGPPAFATMTRLRLLSFDLPEGENTCKVHIPEGIEVLPTELRCLRWDRFPSKALPASFNTENLVKLDLRNSLLEKLWDGEKDLANLKSMDLSSCKRLVELPDLSNAVNLEELHLGSCISLREVPSYVLSLDHLLALNLEGCTQLQCCRSDMHSKSLRWLNLSGCSNLVEFSVISDKLEFLSLKDTGIEELSSSIWQNKNLSCLYLSGCLRLKKLPPIVGTSLSIKSLFLNGCSNLSELPDDLKLLAALDTLSVQGSCIETLPASTKHLSQLRSLDVSYCKRLRSLPELPLLLQHLNAKGCISLETVSSSAACKLMQNSFGCQNWKSLLKQHQELKVSLHHFHFFDMFEFNHCRRLNENARNTIMIEAITRIKHAVPLSSLAQTDDDPYNQFQLFSKGSDAETLEFTCRQLCPRPLGGNIPDWFWLREIESSSMIIKLNANCCSHCKRSSFAFGVFRTNEEEDPHLRFGGRHRICVKQLVESPLWSFEKLWYNDVRVCLPGQRVPSEFRHGRRDQTCVRIQLPWSSDLLGFAFCVISSHYPLTDNGCSPMIRCECYFDDAECTRPYQSDYFYPHELEWKPNSDTVFLWFDEKTSNSILQAIKESSDIDQSTTYKPRLSFKFYSKSGIKECGVWPIHASDLESQMLALKRSRPCPSSDEQQFPIERNPHKKLQALHRTMELNREIRRSRQTKKLKKRSQQIPDAMCIFLKALNLFLITYPVSTGIAFH